MKLSHEMLSENDIENIALNFKNILSHYNLASVDIDILVDKFCIIIEEEIGVKIG